MSSHPTRYRPNVERSEPRVLLSAVKPLAVVNGSVPTSGATAQVSFPVSRTNIGQRHSIVLGATVQPSASSTLAPKVAGATGPSGERLPVHQGIPSVPGTHGPTQAYIRTGEAGKVTTGVTGRKGTTGSFELTAALPGDVNGDGQVNISDLQAFAKAYLTVKGDALYNPAADANHNGFIGHGDARIILRNETPLTPKIPLKIELSLAPGDQIQGPHSINSGGVTNKQTVTIVGHTTPGSIIFADSGNGDYTFTGKAIVPDANGNFTFSATNTQGINNFEFLAIDPFGQQTIQDYPVFWEAFAAPHSKIH